MRRVQLVLLAEFSSGLFDLFCRELRAQQFVNDREESGLEACPGDDLFAVEGDGVIAKAAVATACAVDFVQFYTRHRVQIDADALAARAEGRADFQEELSDCAGDARANGGLSGAGF